ncbi:5'-methylthioadenosine/adenosylhomocysteine nucleosidase [Aquabacterium sp. J223]|uniref:5'-methylthioadenosine/adenosylhomocysteine nucleosidase n=1 Tax=Aquabacterium sp. J223 TaxID=2898431 RepID=UPI0021AD5762|nr:5'-methylthioadenosine/adenosylhomocysteine nucleosidase [Aquabacterium sp. J223]UUX95859.1 5'-methylthioadenosine/adenosylhomocysteine nucleosidase [Aquabacterium sp. J223]
MRLAVVCAMEEEIRALRTHLVAERIDRTAGRDVHVGALAGQPVVMVRSGIGKVAAATTAALLLDRHAVDAVLLTGVAGGLGDGVAVGDVVVADALLQHDLDASPLFPRFEVPLTGRSRFATDPGLSDRLATVAATVAPAVHRGLVVSGDRFVSRADESAALRGALPEALAVEMEGAAMAQVCHDFGRPLAVCRIVSDRADDDAHTDFQRFVADVAAEATRRLVLGLLQTR